MKYDVFISYSSNDQKVVEALSHYLEENKIRCFVTYRDIPKGKVWAAAITEAIEDCQMMVVVFSENFNSSDQVDREIEMCSEEKKPILTYRITDTNFKGAKKYYLKNLNWIDAFPDPKSNFSELLHSISKLINIETQAVEINNESITVKEDNAKYFNLKIKPDADCVIYVDDEEVTDAVCGKITKLELRKGNYSLRFESKLYPSFSKEQIYRVESVDTEELIMLEIKDGEVLLSIPDNQLKPYTCEGGCGFNYNGVSLLSLKYDEARVFRNGLAAVKLNGKWGFIDKTGKEIIPLKYDHAEYFKDGFAKVKLNDKYGFIDKMGKEVIPLKYDDVWSFKDGFASVRLNDKWGLVDKASKKITPFKYDFVWCFADGLAKVELNGKSGFVDKTGKEITLWKYDDTQPSSDGLAAVKLNGKWGFIDKLGKEIIPLKYDDAWYFQDGFARVELNNKLGFIDKTGKEIIPLKYDTAWHFEDGFARVELNGKWGFIDKTGKEIIPLKYDDAWDFEDDFADIELNGKSGRIDKQGNEYWE